MGKTERHDPNVQSSPGAGRTAFHINLADGLCVDLEVARVSICRNFVVVPDIKEVRTRRCCERGTTPNGPRSRRVIGC